MAALGDDDGVRQILVEICALTGMSFSALAFVSEDRWIACQVEDRIDFGLAPGDELEVRKTICDDIRRFGKPIMIDDTENDRDWWNHPVPILYGFHSYVSLPITLDDGAFFGTLCALDPGPSPHHLEDLRADLESLARRAGAILSGELGEHPAGNATPVSGA
jgi:GAF domain-containing protein